ncbi:hypothetical protein C8J57DRAFT_1093114 [Mycena rebaudengoi]|nr:hypothetical protein C8J57DRAFT_1093114 [Mycena rebaudengoi]
MKHCPGEIHEWVKATCWGSPEINDMDAFTKHWWVWWESLNPEWRRQGSRLMREGTGDWRCLDCPGTNGFMNIMVCLKWWGAELVTEEELTKDWLEAIRDVTWVLEHNMQPIIA